MRPCQPSDAPARLSATATILVFTAVALAACAKTEHRQLTQPSEYATLDQGSPYLKAHMRDGRVYVLRDWRIDGNQMVVGVGERLNVNRMIEAADTFRFSIDSVVIFETNRVSTSPSAVALGVITAVSLGVTAYCVTNPKACFGSCPTFYVHDGERPRLQAEGFSSSVSPALEGTDIDALYRARPNGSELELRMTNEALETHVVRHADVLAAQRPPGGRVFVTQSGEFRQATGITTPAACRAPEGDCTAAVAAFDGEERFSQTDSTDLAVREHLELEFPELPGRELGLVIASRETLLTTYLFYQALAYMGRQVGTYLAALERGDRTAREKARGIGQALGGIEVYVEDERGAWALKGELYETGPLATDVRMVPLGRHRGPTRVRLRLTQGLWRLDWIALATLDGRVEPLRLRPVSVRRDGVEAEDARQSLLDPAQVLTTLPGDEYTLIYRLPDAAESYELFLESRGYYLEWIRESWLQEEDPARAAMMLRDPRAALRALAPEFKKIEPVIEDSFWRSRYVRP